MKSRKEALQLEKKLGVITVLNFEKGYGFIQCPPDSNTEYFMHASDIVKEPEDDVDEDKFELLNTGDKVEFTPIWSNKKNGWKAIGVRLVND
jgi:cold shock CspA family protein